MQSVRRIRLATLVFITFLLTACAPTPLYTSLGEQQANELMAVLLHAGVRANKSLSKDKKSWSVSVPRDQIPQAMKLLADRGLPRASKKTLGEVFEKKGFVSAGLELKARYLFGLSQELERTLMEIDGVMSARVHIALPEKDTVKGIVKPSSASVVIIARNGAEIVARETDVVAIVKDSIEGLDDINKVTVRFFTTDGSDLPEVEQPAQPTVALAGIRLDWLVVVATALLFLIGATATWFWRRSNRQPLARGDRS